MSNDIDEISLRLGNIQADLAHIRRNTELTESKVTKISEQSIRHEASVKSAHKRLDAFKEHLEEEIKPHIDDYKNTKQRGIGATAVLGGFFGLIGAGLLKIAMAFFS